MFDMTEVQVFFVFYTMNEYYIILSFVLYACICWQANEYALWYCMNVLGKKYTYLLVPVSIID